MTFLFGHRYPQAPSLWEMMILISSPCGNEGCLRYIALALWIPLKEIKINREPDPSSMVSIMFLNDKINILSLYAETKFSVLVTNGNQIPVINIQYVHCLNCFATGCEKSKVDAEWTCSRYSVLLLLWKRRELSTQFR